MRWAEALRRGCVPVFVALAGQTFPKVPGGCRDRLSEPRWTLITWEACVCKTFLTLVSL